MTRILCRRWCGEWLAGFMIGAALWYTSVGRAATLYVWPNSDSPGTPYTNWSTAAHTIQEAVDAAAAGDVVLVTNGVYATGGRVVNGSLTNRVAITNAIVLTSVNGPTVTTIVGARTNNGSPIRCVYLGTNATLIGFTLTNGQTLRSGTVHDVYGGGVWCQPSAVVSNCVVRGNEASSGGGVREGTLYNCILEGNTAVFLGGGAYSSRLNFCGLTGNRSGEGGGAHSSTVFHCTVTGNTANDGGGVRQSTVESSIVYFNAANVGANYSGSTLRNACSWPLLAGEGNIAADPLLASATHLSTASPCRDRLDFSRNAVDIDGERWVRPGDLGADQLLPGWATNALTVAIEIPYTKVAAGFPLPVTARIEGQTLSSRWSFGEGTVISNQPFSRHAWTIPGRYELTLTAFNNAHDQGISATALVEVVSQPVYYVNSARGGFTPPYTNWSTASRSIQEAIAADTLPGRLVLVTNGLYQMGFMEPPILRLTNGVIVRSVNGPVQTLIRGTGPSAACAQLASDCVLSGFTVTNGSPGVSSDFSAVVTNCILDGNTGFGFGGGAQGGTLTHCIIRNNSAYHGGGAYGCRAYNCVFAGNSADYGGAVERCLLDHCTIVSNVVDYTYDGAVIGSLVYNSIIQFNIARGGMVANHQSGTNTSVAAFSASCTTPMPFGGPGNFTNAPLFVDAARGDFHLRYGSPGIDAGIVSLTGPLLTDLEGRRRPLDGDGDAAAVVDVGAYEFDLVGVVTTNWLTRYGLDPFDPHVFRSDPDSDGQTTLQEWIADTNPASALSVFRIASVSRSPSLAVHFMSTTNRLYTLHRAHNLTNNAWRAVSGQTDILGSGGPQTLHDTSIGGAGFYRLSVRLP